MQRTSFVVLLAVSVGLSAFTCEVFPPGGGTTSMSYFLGVPYFPQECTMCCSAASIQMLQAYCQWPPQPQLAILQAIGGSPTTGAGWHQIAAGVNQLTCYDGASVSYYPNDSIGKELAVTEQISTVVWNKPHRPVLPQTGFNHVGVLVGGSAFQSNLKYYWNSVRIHDPQRGVNDLPAQEWLGTDWFGGPATLIQIVPATVQPPAAQSLWEEYRGYVDLWDGGGYDPPFENL